MKLSAREKSQLKKFLSENLDVFTWSPTYMLGVDPSVIYHKLSILPDAKPVKQKLQKMNAERLQTLNDEVPALQGWFHPRNPFSRLAHQSSSVEEEKWEVERLHRLHRLEQGLSQKTASRYPA